ncbi:MAG: serine/threonine-protein kinase [Eggerthellaceae bacterium]|nr:serine/threonine-protein kinase [Eggerthellaceae bacterium]
MAQKLILDRYRILGRAGAGGYGTVQHAYDTHLKRDVAIKCIELSEADVARARLLAMEESMAREAEAAENPAFPKDPSFLDAREVANSPADLDNPNSPNNAARVGSPANNVNNFGGSRDFADPAAFDDLDDIPDDDLFDHIPGLAEAQTVAKLNDANIVTVYDCVVEGATAYIVMEYVEGKTLARIMREMGDEISLDVVAAVFTSVAHALEFAHDADVLHLDIKPENVIVNTKGVVKVTDFGLATLMDGSGQGTAGGGTIGYMPLEQMRQEALDVRTDEWALASLTYEMLSGSNPFRADTLEQAEGLIENAELVLPSLCWDALPAEADDIMFMALDPDPDERYGTVASFAEELTPLLGNARAGKRALAAAVRGEEAAETDESAAASAEPCEPLPPLIDRLGPVGASVVGRVLAVAGAVMMAAVALVNVHVLALFGGASAAAGTGVAANVGAAVDAAGAAATQAAAGATAGMFGVASDFPVVFWALLLAVAVLSAVRPAFGVLAAYIVMVAMFLLNFAIAPGLVLLAALIAWWWFVGRRSNGAATAALLAPLGGSIGLGAVAPVAAGALLDVREAAATAAFSVVSALVFASLGSGSLFGWNIMENALVAASPSIALVALTDGFLGAATSPATWCAAVSWILAGTVFSLFCMKGSRAFDVAGACAACALLIAGACVAAGAASAGVTWLPDVAALVGSLVPGALGIALAAGNVCDRVRLAEGEW